MKNNRLLSFFVLFLSMIISCSKPGVKEDIEQKKVGEDKGELQLLAINASQTGVNYPETFILMQNRMGMRIEYCVDRSNLQLWLSPQAGKSMSYKDRNWSNRDDHMNLFNRILIPGFNLQEFEKCDYDPFHSVIQFKKQKIHLLNIYDQPILLVWFENEGVIDFKTDYDDKVIERSDSKFVIDHSDRGKTFTFAAITGKGNGKIRHQLVTDDGRSIYSRAELKANQLIAISGELKQENIDKISEKYTNSDIAKLISENEEKISKALDFGKFKLKNRNEMQKLLDINRRIALSMQDEKGFMRSTNQYIYYLLWFRDGGMNTAHICYTGWTNPAKWQADFALKNPNISNEEPKGKFFGQVMGGPITKWEEDGLFYVLWPAFSYWSQTGDDTYIKGEYLKTMEEAMDWLERYCYDKEQGLFGRYYYCETPTSGSRDDGWDNAVGSPNFKWPSKYKDTIITRAYDLYINMLNYNNYIMLSAMETGPKADDYLKKAISIEKNMKKFYEYKGNLPSYGDLLSASKNIIQAEPFGMDITDYQWSLSIPPFTPTLPSKFKEIRDALYKDLRKKPQGNFVCSYAAILTSMDNEIHNEDSIMAALDYLVPQSVRAGKYLAMPYTIPEIVDIEDGDPFHDVRPLVYSIAPWLSAVTNLGVRKLPFGIAARATKYLENIENFEFRNALIDFRYQGEGQISKLLINGKELKNSSQIPENWLQKGDNQVLVEMSKGATTQNTLISSTVRLIDVKIGDKNRFYTIEAYGKNVLVFKNLDKKITIKDAYGKEIIPEIQNADNLTYIEFIGRGLYIIDIPDL